MNKKGFTLTELLAVIVILAIIMTIGLKGIYSINHSARVKLLSTKIEEIETAAIKYGQEHLNDFLDNCGTVKYKNSKGEMEEEAVSFCITLTVQDLLGKNGEAGYFRTDEKDQQVLNPATNEPLNNEEVFIYKKNNRVYAIMPKKYEIIENS